MILKSPTVGICISDHVQSIPESLKGIKVRDFVNGSGTLDKIGSIQPPNGSLTVDADIFMMDRVDLKAFMWLLKHDRLLTNHNKSRRGFSATTCNLCGHANESTLHVFRECPRALEVWVNKVPSKMHHEFFNLDLEGWIKLNINGSTKKDGGWSSYWAMASLEMDNKVVGRTKEVRLIKWIPPSLSIVKFNVNGACIEGVDASCGGLVRDDEGCWMRGFAKHVGICSSYMAELWGLLEGLMFV
ncbi:hypothetical protein KIW84_075073 [Lathyrus oleraceus]|uniref:Reverse transcriptase zinc-binding domain-containing protein n=1 Tax=Pisum sativum TaxID=3888 RepID=A0A9D4VST4_PEA|nr:hypothetical protein KIW84_075073 [Pisum sativum]